MFVVCDFNVAGGVRFDAGVDALCVGIDFLFFVFAMFLQMALQFFPIIALVHKTPYVELSILSLDPVKAKFHVTPVFFWKPSKTIDRRSFEIFIFLDSTVTARARAVAVAVAVAVSVTVAAMTAAVATAALAEALVGSGGNGCRGRGGSGGRDRGGGRGDNGGSSEWQWRG